MLESKVKGLEIEFHRAYWESQIHASEENDRRRADLELQLRRLKGDPEALSAIEDALQGDVHEPALRRQLELLRLSFTGNQMDESHRARIVELSSAVESEFASHRPIVDGKEINDNQIEEILRISNDEDERRVAWEASKEIGARVAERVRELARLRNEAAHKLGFGDYYRMSLHLQEIDEDWLFEQLGKLDRLTTEPFSAWKEDLDAKLRARFGVERLSPWHYADPFFQTLPPDGRVSLDALLADTSAPDLAAATFGAWGIDLANVVDRSDLFPRQSKCQHAFCLDVDRSGKDVRILANVVPGEHWTEIMLHESGHAAYDICIDQEMPYLLRRAAHTFTTEAVALVSGRLVRHPTWLTDVAKRDRSEVAALEADLRRATMAQEVLFARWGLVMCHFERELYSDPEGDLDARWWELVSRFQQVAAPEGRAAPDWAAKIHVAAAPVYYQNYLLGNLLAWQLEATAEATYGALIGSSDAGAFLVDKLFRPGSLLRWDALVEQATGSPLGPEAFGARLQNAF
ncbi:MAG: M2 family metallopeptidase [Actinomycetota bacterium]